MRRDIFIGTAGWAIPKAHAQAFPGTGVGLARYAAVFNSVEINSTFYRPHRPATFERWRDTVPDHFRFAVKVPKAITHEQQLVGTGSAFAAFVSLVSGLGERLGPFLFQLPPKLTFDAKSIEVFLREAKATAPGPIVIEPRHKSWFSDEANALLAASGVARAGADPERHPGAHHPGGARRLSYRRLHGSPRIYFSPYDPAFVDTLADQIARATDPTWCIFDNTASGAAAGDALSLLRALER